jgi:hypothetical protein
MSQNELHTIANSTSPDYVQVPNTIMGLIVWATAKFGIGVIGFMVLGYAITHVYSDLTVLNNRVLAAFERQTEAATANKEAIQRVADTLRRIEEDHRRLTRP